MTTFQQKDIDRFWPKVNKTDGCWLWTAAKFRFGHGAFQLNGQACKAHRIAYELTYGPIPAGMLVCHQCDNPSCVRPDHLWLGTIKDNNNDRHTKGRTHPGRNTRSGYKLPPGAHAGERNSHAKLTEQQVTEIRQRYTSEVVAAQQLADEYNVSVYTIHKVTGGETWTFDTPYTGARRPTNIASRLRSAERSGKTKLTWPMVNDIRQRYAEGTMQKQLADEYKVGQSTIGRIVRYEVWKPR